MTEIELKAIAWRNSDHTGMSSIALVCCILGWPNGGNRRPYDIGDFGRCLRAVEEIPGLRDGLDAARTMSHEWNAIIEHWDELAELCKLNDYDKFDDRFSALVDIYCSKGCGELKWESETIGTCPTCGATKNMRDPRLPKPAPQKVQRLAVSKVRDNLVVLWLIIDENGYVSDSVKEECPECDGDGTIECSECEEDRDCTECDGTGTVKTTRYLSDSDLAPQVEEGETAIVAIVDRRRSQGPRLVYDDVVSARRGLKYLLELPDATLDRMFTEKAAA